MRRQRRFSGPLTAFRGLDDGGGAGCSTTTNSMCLASPFHFIEALFTVENDVSNPMALGQETTRAAAIRASPPTNILMKMHIVHTLTARHPKEHLRSGMMPCSTDQHFPFTTWLGRPSLELRMSSSTSPVSQALLINATQRRRRWLMIFAGFVCFASDIVLHFCCSGRLAHV
ncbi:hypothetical protein B0T20DRAFT_219567 [Sordaria brevicollis]|uniref:Uncharacterized protein n=1 Tax=Sordaria brevicollis TaxID=83679 RepID=A0AAE0PF85_SORBR|nr:hypothetical protein B0T20DRAFT_219567 [Sordaria brevicollis]